MVSADPSADPGAAADATIGVEVAWSPAPREMRRTTVRLPPDATVADAVRACGWQEVQAVIDDPGSRLSTAVWGQACEVARALRDGDRVEILRVLVIDPMDARRERFEAAGGVQALRRKRQALQPKKDPTSRSSGK